MHEVPVNAHRVKPAQFTYLCPSHAAVNRLVVYTSAESGGRGVKAWNSRIPEVCMENNAIMCG